MGRARAWTSNPGGVEPRSPSPFPRLRCRLSKPWRPSWALEVTAVRILIADDEPIARQVLREHIESIPGLEVAGEASTGPETLQCILDLQPDLVLLDLQMPELDGLATARFLRGSRTPAVIFVTAYERHALEAFEVGAVDYVLKPVRRERLEQAIEKARKQAPARGWTIRRAFRFSRRSAAENRGPPRRGYVSARPLRDRGVPGRGRAGSHRHGFRDQGRTALFERPLFEDARRRSSNSPASAACTAAPSSTPITSARSRRYRASAGC